MSRLFFRAICKACCRLRSRRPSCESAGAGVGAVGVPCVCASKPDGCGAAGITDAADIDCKAATEDEEQPTAMQIKACRAAERLSKHRKKQLISHNSPSGRAGFVDSACPIYSFARELYRSWHRRRYSG